MLERRKKKVCLCARCCDSPPPCSFYAIEVYWSFLLCKVLQQWIHRTWNYHFSWQNGGEQVFKAARLYGWKTWNHVRMLAAHLALALCVCVRVRVRVCACVRACWWDQTQDVSLVSPKTVTHLVPRCKQPCISMPTHLIKNHPLYEPGRKCPASSVSCKMQDQFYVDGKRAFPPTDAEISHRRDGTLRGGESTDEGQLVIWNVLSPLSALALTDSMSTPDCWRKSLKREERTENRLFQAAVSRLTPAAGTAVSAVCGLSLKCATSSVMDRSAVETETLQSSQVFTTFPTTDCPGFPWSLISFTQSYPVGLWH